MDMGLLTRLRRAVVSTFADAASPIVAGALKESGRQTSKWIKQSTEPLEEAVASLSKQLAQLEEQQRATLAALEDVKRLGQSTHVRVVDTNAFDEGAYHAAIQVHVGTAIGATPMTQVPFPHLVVRDALPAAFYDALLRAMPPPTFWRDAGFRRENWHVDTDHGPVLSETTWRYMHRVVGNQMIMPALLERFRSHIQSYWTDYFGIDAASVDGHYVCGEGRLLLRRAGYKLEPHLDPPRAVLTVLMYLARPGDGDAFGTDIYASDPLPVKRVGIYYPGREGLNVRKVGTVPFTPNTLLAFMTATSVHGAELPADTDPQFERFTYQLLVMPDDETWRRVRRHRDDSERAPAAY
jgi:hypothetical protein